jgi:glycerol uptake facilitator-like aquaporin
MIEPRKLAAEGIGTALLLAIVVGSGIMGERLAGGNTAIALLANSIATGAGLYVLILVFGPISGAHFNPAVTLVAAVRGELARGTAVAFIVVQFVSALAGVAIAHLMFDLPIYSLGTHPRTGIGPWFSEFVATFGLLLVILSCAKHRPHAVPLAVGAYIASAYWFTASTSFANPAVTLARATTNTFTGIYPGDVLGFITAQVFGAGIAAMFFGWFAGRELGARGTSRVIASESSKVLPDRQEAQGARTEARAPSAEGEPHANT